MAITKAFVSNPAQGVSNDGWILDHVAHAVHSLDDALPFYTDVCGFSVEQRDISEDQGVEAAFLRMGAVDLELIAPLSEKSPVMRFLEKRGAGLHHICFRVNSVAAELSRLTALGTELIDKSPRQGLRNKVIAFIHPRATGGILVELCSKQAT